MVFESLSNEIKRSYNLLSINNLWGKGKNAAIDYSDGDETEDYIYKSVKNAQDKGVFSAELISSIKDWPSYYYFSPIRTNLLRPLVDLFKGTGLEVGCGCGALTRYLGECGAEVVALEGSLRRAKITALRCEDLKNVNVVVDNAINFNVKGFSWATLIGVLEYSPKFIEADDPVEALLRHIYSLLDNNGVLVIAIENLLGLKYLAGAPEDHYGLPFFGTNDSYPKANTKTFTKKYLTDVLRNVGFDEVDFWYPFPDYKQPRIIFTENALAYPDLLKTASRNCRGRYDETKRTFSEEIAWNAFIENGNFSDLSNSFLILAHKGAKRFATSSLAFEYSTENGKSGSYESLFSPSLSGVKIQRRALSDELLNNDLFEQKFLDEVFPSGNNYLDILLKILNTPNWSLDEIVQWAWPWKEYLESQSDNGVLPSIYYNCFPQNIVKDSFGKLQPYNLIWSYKNELTVNMVVTRGVLSSFLSVSEVADSPCIGLTMFQIIQGVLSGLNLEFDYDVIKKLFIEEAKFGIRPFGEVDDISLRLEQTLPVRCSIR